MSEWQQSEIEIEVPDGMSEEEANRQFGEPLALKMVEEAVERVIKRAGLS